MTNDVQKFQTLKKIVQSNAVEWPIGTRGTNYSLYLTTNGEWRETFKDTLGHPHAEDLTVETVAQHYSIEKAYTKLEASGLDKERLAKVRKLTEDP